MNPATKGPDEQLARVLQRNLRDLLRAGELSRAAEVLTRLEEVAPLALETRAFSLELLLRGRSYQEAAALAMQLVELFSASAHVQYRAGIAAYRLRNYSLAAERLRESRRLHPHWKFSRWLGKTLTQLGELERAEGLLAELVESHPVCLTDLAWVHERRGDPARALELLEAHRKRFPDDAFVAARIKRLRTRGLSPEEILQEMALLEELGEEAPPELESAFVRSLLAPGQGKRARELVRERRRTWSREQIREVAWDSYRLQAFDLACELLLQLFPGERSNFKYMNTLERTAQLCGRLDTLVERYESAAESDRTLYGRLKKLRRRLED